MEWGVNSSKNGPGTCQWINNLLLTALPHSHREILKYSLKRGILSWINTSRNPIQSEVCGHIEHARQKHNFWGGRSNLSPTAIICGVDGWGNLDLRM